MTQTSKIENFRNLSPQDRLRAVIDASGNAALGALSGAGALSLDRADGMIENVVGVFELPLGVATNFVVNGKHYLIPMAVEEPSVVAAASHMAKLAAPYGGFSASHSQPIMRGQIQITGVSNPASVRQILFEHKESLISSANSKDHVLVGLGGGCKDFEVHEFPDTPLGPMVVLHILVDVRDAMGANTVNTMAEMLAPRVEHITGGRVRLRILSNLADLRVARARVKIPFDGLNMPNFSGKDVAHGIVEAATLAMIDPYRAATHNKGIMNGIDPIVIATGNDWRAIEAGAHAYAAKTGRYQSLTRWEISSDDALCGSIELPMAVGLVGGATKSHPAAQAALALMEVTSANELGQVIAAVGLAQNMAALRALATEGIQRGHMTLHARNIAISAGATGAQIDHVVCAMLDAGDISASHAKAIIDGH